MRARKRLAWITLAIAIVMTLAWGAAQADLSTRVEQALSAMFNAAGQLVRLDFLEVPGPHPTARAGRCVVLADSGCNCLRVSCNAQNFGVVLVVTPTPTATATATATPTVTATPTLTPTPTPTPT